VSKERKELPYEARVLMAFLLSVVVMVTWSYFFRPTPPPPGESPAAEQAAPQQPGAPAQQPSPSATQPAKAGEAPAATMGAAPASALPQIPAVQAAQEEIIVVENGEYRVELSNRGAVVRSWTLLNYKDSSKQRQTLDVVNAEAAQQLGAWPLALAVADGDLNQRLNSALYEVAPAPTSSGQAGGPLKAPTEVTFRWSDGTTSASKTLKFDESYVVEITTSVEQNGQPVQHTLTWRGGFGDQAVKHHPELVRVLYRTGGVMHALEHKKLGQPGKQEQWFEQPEKMEYAGIQDQYFAAVFLPDLERAGEPGGAPPLSLWHWKREQEIKAGEKTEKAPVSEVAVRSAASGPMHLHLFVGPKDLDVLAAQRPPMTELVDFGWDWLEPIARLLFAFLKWIYAYVPNWGWAIVLMTVAINTLLFPLKVKSWRSMQKMQKLMPEMQQIKQRYAKYKFNDPRKQEEQQEMMALYKKHGVNPLSLGGCLPMLLQMPIWFALYQMLGASIELRHAPWLLWIRDLSSPDPYYILPVLMAVSMWGSQKMTPVTTPDPAQARMMQMMPVIFGGMFVVAPVSSGLVLYIFTSMVVGMAQQWYLNKTNPLQRAADEKKEKYKK
jgi:YidC/Oxa1 family membrane protein insertase